MRDEPPLTPLEDSLRARLGLGWPKSKGAPHWLSLLSYMAALIYHEREKPERDEMRQMVVDSVQNDSRRVEVRDMGQTIAEALEEEGRIEGAVRSLRATLVDQLETKFGDVPTAVRRRIENTEVVAQLRAWLKAFATARRLPQVGIPPLE